MYIYFNKLVYNISIFVITNNIKILIFLIEVTYERTRDIKGKTSII